MTVDRLPDCPEDCDVHTLDRCPACVAPVLERPLGGRPALWDAIGCDHDHDKCTTYYELHTPRRCARLATMLRHPAGRLIGAAAQPAIDTVPASGPWEGLPALRPVSVRKIDGEWFLYDAGGGLQVRTGHRDEDLEPMPSRPCCCWDAAQGLADVLERHYLGLEPPSWSNNGQHPPVRDGQTPCVDGITTS